MKRIDFGRVEARNIDGQIVLKQQARQLAEFGGKDFSIPSSIGRDLIVSECQGTLFRVTQPGDPDDRNLQETDVLGGSKSTVTSEDDIVFIRKKRGSNPNRLMLFAICRTCFFE